MDLLSLSAMPWRCRSTCLIGCCKLTMSVAVTMRALLRMLQLLLLRNLGNPLPAPLCTARSEAPLECQLEVCVSGAT